MAVRQEPWAFDPGEEWREVDKATYLDTPRERGVLFLQDGHVSRFWVLK